MEHEPSASLRIPGGLLAAAAFLFLLAHFLSLPDPVEDILILAAAGGGGALMIFRGMAARRRAAVERERADDLERRKALPAIEQSPVAVMFTDREGRIEYVNRSYTRMTGYDAAETVGTSWRCPTGHDPDACVGICRALEFGTEWKGEFRGRRKDGGVYWESASIFPVRDSAGNVTHFSWLREDITDRKQSEAALSRTTELLEKIFSNIHLMVVYLDTGFRFLRVNRAYADACGRSPESLIGRNHFDLFPHEENEAIFRKVVETGEPYVVHGKPFEHPDRPGQGLTYWDWSLHPVRDPDGRIEGLLFCLLDVTERRRAEAEQRRSDLLFRTVFRDAPVGVALADTDGRILRGNAMLEETFGYGEVELRGMACADLLHPEDVEAFRYDIERLKAGRADTYMAVRRYRRKDGRFIRGRVTGSLIAVPEGGPAYLLSMISDITAQVEAEQALRESEERFRTSVENMLDGFAILSAVRDASGAIVDFRIEYMNEAGCRYVGSAREELLGAGMLRRFPSTRDSGLFGKCVRVVETGEPLRHEDRGEEGAGERTSDLRATRFGDGIAVSWRDVTERVEAEKRLRAVVRAHSTLSSCMNALVRATDEQELVREICRIAVEEGEYRLAWVGMAEDDGEKTVTPVASWGVARDYLDALQVRWDESTYGQGPTGAAIRTGRFHVVRNFADTPEFAPWLRKAQEHGLRSSIALPLFLGDRVVGALTIYSGRTDAFDDEEAHLFRELSDNLSFGIAALRNRAERRLAQEALRASEERLELALGGGGLGLWDWDLARGTVIFDDRWAGMLGYDREELPPRYETWERLVHPEDLPGAVAALRAHLEGISPVYEAEIRLRAKSGEWRWILTRGEVVERDAAGRPARATGTHLDITERKRAEEAVRESEERFRRIFEQNEVPVILFRSGSAEVFDVNPAAEGLYGFTREELRARGIDLFVGPESRDAFGEALASLVPGPGVHLGKMKHRRRDGGEIVVSARANSIRLREGQFSYCTLHDVTEQVRLEKAEKLHQAQLIHASRMASLGAVVSGVAHEINNPNNLVMFNVPMIEAAWQDASPVLDERCAQEGEFSLGGLPYTEMREVVPRLLSGISDAALRIRNIVANLKDFARQDKARTVRPLDVNEVVRLAVSILNHEIMKGTHDFRADYGEELPPVEGVAQELEQVVVNLITNALQALPDTGRAVRVSTSADRESGRVLIDVRDEGTGMTEEVLALVAEPFFTTKHDRGGLGLGLSICRSIVEGHRGTLHFETEVGRGTTVRVALPCAAGTLEDPEGIMVMR